MSRKDSNLHYSEQETIQHLRTALEQGCQWPVAFLEAMSKWPTPKETHRGRLYNYFIAGEAFDCLLLVERLFQTVSSLISNQDIEDLLFTGRWPNMINPTNFKRLLGMEKHRGHLNFFYGIMVEEALQSATEQAVHKRLLSNGNQYQHNFSHEAFSIIYREAECILFEKFQEETDCNINGTITLTESKEFTYWLFKYRLSISEKAKVASDTQKGLEHLQRVTDLATISRIENHSVGLRPMTHKSSLLPTEGELVE